MAKEFLAIGYHDDDGWLLGLGNSVASALSDLELPHVRPDSVRVYELPPAPKTVNKTQYPVIKLK